MPNRMDWPTYFFPGLIVGMLIGWFARYVWEGSDTTGY